jgi:ribosomal protein L39E
MVDDLIKTFRSNPEFVQMMKAMQKNRPVIPAFSLAQTADEQYMIVERIKYATAMRQGFDILYQHLTGIKGD